MNIPTLKLNEYSVIRAEKSTGKILNNDNSYYQSTGEDYYYIFSSLVDAKEFIDNEHVNKKTSCEYLIYDYNGDFVDIVR